MFNRTVAIFCSIEGESSSIWMHMCMLEDFSENHIKKIQKISVSWFYRFSDTEIYVAIYVTEYYSEAPSVLI